MLSSSGDGSGALERFLHVKLDSLSRQGLERIVEADPSGLLALLDEIGDRHAGGHETVLGDEG